MYKNHVQCRACGYAAPPYPGKSAPSGEKLVPVFDLGLQPLANDFVAAGEEQAGFAPLKVVVCPRCTLAQLSVTVNPSVLYSRYNYITSQSQTMLKHFGDILQWMPKAGSILEIGSNDGFFLAYARSQGVSRVLGLDPAENLAKVARERGVDTVCGLLDEDSARKAREFFGEPDLIVARHVFCHVDNWEMFLYHLASLCSRKTLVYLEVPWVMDLLQNGEFDTIYHEHTSYLSLHALEAVLHSSPFRIKNAVRWPIHGGAIGVLLEISGQGHPGPEVQRLMDTEPVGNRLLETWREFDVKCHSKIGAVQAFVDNAVNNGKRVVGYGASAKSTVWINACQFNRRHLNFVCDNTPLKQYKFSPGSDIPIADDGALTRELPDYAVCFAWNFSREIISKERLFAEKGGKWVLPHPNIQVV